MPFIFLYWWWWWWWQWWWWWGDWPRLVVRLVVRLVRLAKTGGKIGGETGPPHANSSTMHRRVVCTDPKTHFFNAKIKAELQKNLVFLNPSIRRTWFDQKSPWPLEVAVSQWHRQTNTNTDRQTDIATNRLNQPKGQFSENSYNTIYYNLNVLGVYFLSIFNRLGVAGAVLQSA